MNLHYRKLINTITPITVPIPTITPPGIFLSARISYNAVSDTITLSGVDTNTDLVKIYYQIEPLSNSIARPYSILTTSNGSQDTTQLTNVTGTNEKLIETSTLFSYNYTDNGTYQLKLFTSVGFTFRSRISIVALSRVDTSEIFNISETYTSPTTNYNTNFGYGGVRGGQSDIRLKKNIILIGKSKSNINIYQFEYINHIEGVWIGVIAQELLNTEYECCLGIDEEGFYFVDYNLIDVDFMRVY